MIIAFGVAFVCVVVALGFLVWFTPPTLPWWLYVSLGDLSVMSNQRIRSAGAWLVLVAFAVVAIACPPLFGPNSNSLTAQGIPESAPRYGLGEFGWEDEQGWPIGGGVSGELPPAYGKNRCSATHRVVFDGKWYRTIPLLPVRPRQGNPVKAFGKWIGDADSDLHVYANGERQDTIVIGRNGKGHNFSPEAVVFLPNGTVQLQTKSAVTGEPEFRDLTDDQVKAGIAAFLAAAQK